MRFRILPSTALLLAGGMLPAQTSPGLALDQLLEIGLENSSELRIAGRNVLAARADRRGSYSGLVPSLRASISQNLDPAEKSTLGEGTIIDIPQPPFSHNFSISQTIFDGAQSWYNMRVGGNGLKRADTELERTRQQVILLIKRAYYNHLSALELLDVAEEALTLSRRQLELVEERYRLQAVRETDLLKARVNAGQREIEVWRARQRLVAAVTTLNVALGREPTAALNAARDSVIILPIPEHREVLVALKARNPALAGQGLAVERAWLNAKIQRGVLLPSLSLSYFQSGNADDLGNVFSNANASTALTISVPLFTGLRSSSGYWRARHAARAEEERLEAMERDLTRQLENTFSNLRSLHNIFPINQSVLASAEADVQLAEEQYRLGAISILDLLDAQVSLITARSTLVRTNFEIKIAEADLQALTGAADTGP